MSGRRRDKRGRILKTGETQRSDGSYMYRYTDIHKKRKYVYARTLEKLRQKEADIHRDLIDGIDTTGGEMTVIELVDKYMNLKRDIRENTRRGYGTPIKRIRNDPFGQRRIKDIRKSDAKTWFVKLHDGGLKQNTISVYQSILRPAFEMAVEDDLIRKNPFKFTLSDFIPDDQEKRTALTEEQVIKYLAFMKENASGTYFEEIQVLLETGLRVSELYGLTIRDIDFSSNCIHVRRQLCRTAEQAYFITDTKTKSGVRDIPMTPKVRQILRSVIQSRPRNTIEMIIDGFSGFLFLDQYGKPKVAMHLENYMRNKREQLVKRYGYQFPIVSPHILRHTFCTNMQRAGLDVKSLQYLMGHSTASVTLDVYTHTDYHAVEKAFQKVTACG